MSKDLKTNEKLLMALRTAASSTMTADEMHEQRISFILGTLKEGSGVTRERVVEVLAKQHGEARK